MSDYKEQANSLREHADLIETSGIELYGPSATRLLVYDLRNAAAAIEELQAEVRFWEAAVKGQDDGIKVLQAEVERLQAELEKKRTSDCWGCKCEKLEPKQGEIVRCGECKHYNAGFECLVEGYGIERDPDWYCADGERKEVKE